MRTEPRRIEFERETLEMERVKGIGPSSRPWEGHVLPLYDTRGFRLWRNSL